MSSSDRGDHEASHWFEAIAEHLGDAYLRYSFTYGTDQEVGFLIEALGLQAGMRILDVGCGPGRHANAFAARGFDVVGIDISQTFIDIARQRAGDQRGDQRGDHIAGERGGASRSEQERSFSKRGDHIAGTARFERADARALAFDAEFDLVLSLCQGGFGLTGGPGSPIDDDLRVLGGMARAAKRGGRVVCSAFSAYFRVRYLDETVTFDAERGDYHEVMEVRDAAGRKAHKDGWTTCYTPRELRLLFSASGLVPEQVWSVSPGAYAANRPDLDHYEYLVVGRRPEAS